MNSSPAVRGQAQAIATVYCRLGESVCLVAAESAASWEAAHGGIVVRRLDLAVGGRSFAAFLHSEAPTEAGQPAWHSTSLVEMSDLNRLSSSEFSKLIATIFRLVASTFKLRRDPWLKRQLDLLMADPKLGRGKAVMRLVRGVDTAVCEFPPRLRVAAGSHLIFFDEELAVGDVKAVKSLLAREASERIAAVELPAAAVASGTALVVSPQTIAICEVDLRDNQSLSEFSGAQARSLADTANLLAVIDPGASAYFATAGRMERPVRAVSVEAFSFQFEVTQALSMAHGVFVSGWIIDPDHVLKEALVVDHSVRDAKLASAWTLGPCRVTVDDATLPGQRFHAFLAREEGFIAPFNLTIRLALQNGEDHFLYIPDVCRSRKASMDQILESLQHVTVPEAAISNSVSFALKPLQAALVAEQSVRETVDFGRPSARQASIIIPLYRELGFIRSQLMSFNADPQIRSGCQIVYVCDDPLIASTVRLMLGGSEYVFALDIRLIILNRNGGYALANNVAVANADGDVVVLMNSDVVAENAGWLQTLTERLSSLPENSVIGPKLVYADGSLQHAGMYFHRMPNGQWQNMHYFKGYGRDFPLANVEREVPAVTGAVMVLRREDYLAAGGFTQDYIVGDYEDSDLCLKLRAKGGTCLYAPSVSLIHFERQSMPGSEQEHDLGSTIYNRAIHALRWSQDIEALMARFRGA